MFDRRRGGTGSVGFGGSLTVLIGYEGYAEINFEVGLKFCRSFLRIGNVRSAVEESLRRLVHLYRQADLRKSMSSPSLIAPRGPGNPATDIRHEKACGDSCSNGRSIRLGDVNENAQRIELREIEQQRPRRAAAR